MPTLFQLNGSVKLHFFQFESEVKHLYTLISAEYFKT